MTLLERFDEHFAGKYVSRELRDRGILGDPCIVAEMRYNADDDECSEFDCEYTDTNLYSFNEQTNSWEMY